MTTLEIIDKIQESVDERTAAWQWCEDLRERVESERAALQAAVNNIDTLRALCVGDPAFRAALPEEVLRDALDVINEKTGVTPTEVVP